MSHHHHHKTVLIMLINTTFHHIIHIHLFPKFWDQELVYVIYENGQSWNVILST